AATSESDASSRAGRRREHESENVMSAPGALSQRRPCRPRPAVCSSAARSILAPDFSDRRTVFVEVQRSTTRTSMPGTSIRSAESRSMPLSLAAKGEIAPLGLSGLGPVALRRAQSFDQAAKLQHAGVVEAPADDLHPDRQAFRAVRPVDR